jgi:hypothetical protein
MAKAGLFVYVGRKDEPNGKFSAGDCGMMTQSSGAYANIRRMPSSSSASRRCPTTRT